MIGLMLSRHLVAASFLLIAGCSASTPPTPAHRISDGDLGGEGLYERLYAAFLVSPDEAETIFAALEPGDRSRLEYFVINYKGSVSESNPNSFRMKDGFNRRERLFLKWYSGKRN